MDDPAKSRIRAPATVQARLNSAAIRRANTARVFHALRDRPGSSQRRLADATGLDGATVSAIIARLEAEGVVLREAPRRNGLAGRPESRLAIGPAAGLLIGAAIEPGMISLIAIGLDGRRHCRADLPGTADPAAAIAALRQGIADIAAGHAATAGVLRGVGVGVPGLLDATGHLVLAPNLGWRDLKLGAMLRGAFAVPVQVDNDAKAAALAERMFGAVRGVGDFVLIYGNAGIGGSLHLNGRLYRGCGALAGEIGHMKVVPSGRRCSCGAAGCLEAYVSERAILARLGEAGHPARDAAAIATAAAAGDATVHAVLDEAGTCLGIALANIVNLVNPRAVVLGGNLAALAGALLPAARRALAANGLPVMLGDADLRISPLGTDAVPMGGAAMALAAWQPLPHDV